MLSTRGCWVLGLVGGISLALVACGGSTGGESLGSGSAQATSCAGGSVIKGVDVSHWDGAVNWTSVKASGISFAFAKATESTDLIDDEFAANWSGMKAAGVVRGAYHFFDASADPTAQATYFLATVGTLEAGDLPPVLDFETLNGESEATAVANAATFLHAVTASTGKTAILYMSAEFLAGTYSSLAPYTLWDANYGVTCPGVPAEWATWTFWQNSDSGSVSGISDAVDLDFFNGTLAQLAGVTGGSGGSSSGGSSSGGSSSGGSSSGSSSGGSSSGSSSGGSSSGGGTTSPDACTEGDGFCTATLQCDSGHWIVRQDDPSACTTVDDVQEPCSQAPGYCTATLQCDGGYWVPRPDDPAACTSGPGG
ncbi:MAG: glycoside hydrolase family 25 protein [Polyangiaceae bacterium]